MNCEVIKDLIPLYIDGCCSEESAAMVKEHLTSCDECRAVCEGMSAPADTGEAVSAPRKLSRIRYLGASVLQSLLLFFSFAMITVGVALEASTPTGEMNGRWALSLIIPATGLLLSLASWYFVRLFKSRKLFSGCSISATLALSLCAYGWAGLHYGFGLFGGAGVHLYIGLVLTAVFCVLSGLLSGIYAKMLGKE